MNVKMSGSRKGPHQTIKSGI